MLLRIGHIHVALTFLQPPLTCPGPRFMLHHNGWMGASRRKCAREQARPKSKSLSRGYIHIGRAAKMIFAILENSSNFVSGDGEEKNHVN
jgi:hypothetical protein